MPKSEPQGGGVGWEWQWDMLHTERRIRWITVLCIVRNAEPLTAEATGLQHGKPAIVDQRFPRNTICRIRYRMMFARFAEHQKKRPPRSHAHDRREAREPIAVSGHGFCWICVCKIYGSDNMTAEITTLPDAKIPTTAEEIMLLDRFRKGEKLKGANIQRLQMLADHQENGGALVLTYIVTPKANPETRDKRITMNNQNKRKL